MSIYADSTSVSVSISEEHDHRKLGACQDILHIPLLGRGFDSVGIEPLENPLDGVLYRCSATLKMSSSCHAL